MNRYKICVYAITKNEEKFVDRWMDAVGEADLIVVTDTGSTDATVEKLRARGAVVYPEKIDPWRFDTARNLAMDHIPQDVDVCVSNDLDEVFEPGWRKKLEAAWSPACTRARYLFTWSMNSDGSYGLQFPMEKIHRRRGFRWVHPVHEVLEYTGTDPDLAVWVPGLVLNHYPDPQKPRSQYLTLLELSARENPDDDRTIFWLGREYLYYGRYGDAAQTLERYLKMPSARWDEERSAAMRFLARCGRERGDRSAARVWLYRAAAECPAVREPYLELAFLGYEESDWPLVLFAVSSALKITAKTGSYLTEAGAWNESLYDLGAVCCYHLGLYRQALEYAQEALRRRPGEPRLEKNRDLIRAKLAQEDAENAAEGEA